MIGWPSPGTWIAPSAMPSEMMSWPRECVIRSPERRAPRRSDWGSISYAFPRRAPTPARGPGLAGAGDGDRTGPVHLEAGPAERALDRRGTVGVADEPVGEDEGEPVHRTRRRDAVAELAEAAEILNGRLRSGIEEPDHVITGR